VVALELSSTAEVNRGTISRFDRLLAVHLLAGLYCFRQNTPGCSRPEDVWPDGGCRLGFGWPIRIPTRPSGSMIGFGKALEQPVSLATDIDLFQVDEGLSLHRLEEILQPAPICSLPGAPEIRILVNVEYNDL